MGPQEERVEQNQQAEDGGMYLTAVQVTGRDPQDTVALGQVKGDGAGQNGGTPTNQAGPLFLNCA